MIYKFHKYQLPFLLSITLLVLGVSSLFLFPKSSYAQTSRLQESDILDSLGKKEVYDNHSILQHLLKISKENKYQKAELFSLLALQKDYLTRGDYSNSINYSKQTESLGITIKANNIVSQTLIYRAYANSNLGLLKDAQLNLEKSIFYLKKLDDNNKINTELSNIYTQYANIFEKMNLPDSTLVYAIKSVNSLEKVNLQTLNKTQLYDYYYYLVYGYINIGSCCAYALNPPDKLLAEKYFLKAKALIDTLSINIEDTYPDVYNSIGRFYLHQKEYNSALTFYHKALKAEEKAENIQNRIIAYKGLQDAYQGLGDMAMQNKYLLLYTHLNDSINNSKNKTIILETQSKISKKEAQVAKFKQNIIYNTIIVSCILLGIGLLLFNYFNRKRKRGYLLKYNLLLQQLNKEKQKTNSILPITPAKINNGSKIKIIPQKPDEDLIKKQAIGQEETKSGNDHIESKIMDTGIQNDHILHEDNSLKEFTENVSEKNLYKDSTINIAIKTEEKLLKKLETFEKQEKFLNKDINLSSLAHQWKTNTKYLSSVIKAHKGNSYSGYINKLKIDYIVDKIYNQPEYRTYKISYLAEECGYASSQVFVNAFKKETGLSPSFFIEKIKQDISK
ncbi:MAG TPA: hypothetical protein PKX92_04800 [Edaphocola sp.]|nr:hypothetical protein [Edaphocola sp.]